MHAARHRNDPGSGSPTCASSRWAHIESVAWHMKRALLFAARDLAEESRREQARPWSGKGPAAIDGDTTTPLADRPLPSRGFGLGSDHNPEVRVELTDDEVTEFGKSPAEDLAPGVREWPPAD